MIVPDFNQFGGKHTETAAFRNVLDHLGVVAPHSGQPITEELLFGIGGGIGFAYFLFERSGSHTIHLGTRIHTRETEWPEFLSRIAARIGVRLRVQNSSSPAAAESNLRRVLERGQSVIVCFDGSHLPYLGLHTSMHTYLNLVAYGMDESSGQVLLSGRCKQPISLEREALRAARQTSWAPKYRAMLVELDGGAYDLKAAVTEGIRDCCRQMNNGLGISNFGLRGMEKWASLLTSTKERKSWTKIFSPGATLYEALYSVFAQISARSNTGSANRAFQADFLEEAADILSNAALRSAAQLYREADRLWGELAEAHLPDSVPLLHEAKELTFRRMRLFETDGLAATSETQSIRARLEQIAVQAATQFPIGFEDSRALLHDLRTRILHLRDAEAEAVRALEDAVGSCAGNAPPGFESIAS